MESDGKTFQQKPHRGMVASRELRGYLWSRMFILLASCVVFGFFAFSDGAITAMIFSLLCSGTLICCGMTWVSIRMASYVRRHSWFLYANFMLDALIVTAIVYATGGPISPFLFLYLPLVMGVSILHSRATALAMAAVATGVYSALVSALQTGWLPMPDGTDLVQIPSGGLPLQVTGLISAMVLIAVSTSFLIRKVRFSNAQFEASRRELLEFTAHQRQLVNELPDAVITTDPDFTITSLNQAAGMFLGVDEAQVTGENIFELMEDLDGTSAEVHKAKAREEQFELSFQKNHHHQHIVCRVKAIHDVGGRKAAFLFIIHDVTELRTVEEQLQVHERMAKLLSLAAQDQEQPGLVRTKISSFVGESPVMQQVFKLIARVATSNATVLVSGESGTGKELVARAIHLGSPRASMPFVPVNCGAIPENLIESELFGYKRGAFTGAHQDHNGLFRQADGGTLFLDEIGELPLNMQTKLLRAIQDKAIRQLGGDRSIPVDVRIIAATNKNLKKEVENGRFREDLFYRLNVISIVIPPLRERREDIPLLVNSVLKNLIGSGRTPVVPPATMHLLMNYSYPGNVRELENILERAYVLGGEVIMPDHLPDAVRIVKITSGYSFGSDTTEILLLEDIELPVDLDEILQSVECRYLSAALRKTHGAKKKAAELLGINFRSFRYRLSKFGLSQDDSDSN